MTAFAHSIFAAAMAVAPSPTGIDMAVARRLASVIGRNPGLDQFVVTSINTGILGGVWFAAALFVLWIRAQTAAPDYRRRVITIFAGSLFSILLTLIAGAAVHWPPPANNPQLAAFYPDYFLNPNWNSFPSQSTALYAEIAMGVWGVSALAGGLLWVAVAVAVALPRMYVGGHYLSDIAAGLGCAAAGYWLARLLDRRTGGWAERLPRRVGSVLVVNLVVFAWIWQVSTEFNGVGWARKALALRTAEGKLYLGGDAAFGQYFKGRIDEVRIYSRCLSDTEIRRDMDAAVSGGKSEGLVAAYAFDEGSGETAADTSGNGHEARLRGATWTREGKFQGALQFDGVRSRAEVEDAPTLHLKRAMTLEAWVFPTGVASGWADVLYKATDLYGLEATSEHGPPAVLAGLESGVKTVTAQTTLPLNRWSHLAATYDGANLLLYIDGAVAGRASVNSAFRPQ